MPSSTARLQGGGWQPAGPALPPRGASGASLLGSAGAPGPEALSTSVLSAVGEAGTRVLCCLRLAGPHLGRAGPCLQLSPSPAL